MVGFLETDLGPVILDAAAAAYMNALYRWELEQLRLIIAQMDTDEVLLGQAFGL